MHRSSSSTAGPGHAGSAGVGGGAGQVAGNGARCAGGTCMGVGRGRATGAAGVVEAVDRARSMDLAALGQEELTAELTTVETAIRRLDAWQTRLVGELSDRSAAAAAAEAVSTARGASDGGARAAERAREQARRDVRRTTGWSASKAKQKQKDGRRLDGRPLARRAFDEGRITTEHLRQLDKALLAIPGQKATEVEAELVERAEREDPVVFGRTCREIVARYAPDEAEKDLDRQHAQRSARVTQRPDGMTHLSADVAGVDGAFVHATLDAFRTRDAAGEHRTAEQRTADAFMEMVRAASGTIQDPNARHGLPVFLIQLPAEQLLPPDEVERLRAGNGTEPFTGPLPLGELARLLGSAHLAALLADAKGLPLAVTDVTRGVPTGLWRALVARDRGCVRDGCDAPAGWCQVAHLGDWFVDGGMLSPQTAGLLCTRHHRRYDRGQLSVTWIDGRPTVHRHGDVPDLTGATEVRTRRGGRHAQERIVDRSDGGARPDGRPPDGRPPDSPPRNGRAPEGPATDGPASAGRPRNGRPPGESGSGQRRQATRRGHRGQPPRSSADPPAEGPAPVPTEPQQTTLPDLAGEGQGAYCVRVGPAARAA
jgi:hypothetical protein